MGGEYRCWTQTLLSRADQGDDVKGSYQIALGVRIARADRRRDEDDNIVVIVVVPESANIRRVGGSCVRERHERAQDCGQRDGEYAPPPHASACYLRPYRLSSFAATAVAIHVGFLTRDSASPGAAGTRESLRRTADGHSSLMGGLDGETREAYGGARARG